MNLQTIRKQVTAFLEREDPNVLTKLSVDLFLQAANNARRSLERMHNFEYSRITGTLVINGTQGGLFSDATIAGEATGGIKQLTAVYKTLQNGSVVPLDFTRSDIAIARDGAELELSNDLWPVNRYPSDAQFLALGSVSTIVQRGRGLYIYPGDASLVGQSVPLLFEGIGWLPEYTNLNATAAEDFIVEIGHDYMQWAILCELNLLFREYVPRQEGNLPPPTAERDAAAKAMIVWDSYMVDSNLTRSR